MFLQFKTWIFVNFVLNTSVCEHFGLFSPTTWAVISTKLQGMSAILVSTSSPSYEKAPAARFL